MKITLPAKDRFNENREKFQALLHQQLDLVDKMKSDLVKMQRYEMTTYYRDIERQLESWRSDKSME